jgi:hypothetical protein
VDRLLQEFESGGVSEPEIKRLTENVFPMMCDVLNSMFLTGKYDNRATVRGFLYGPDREAEELTRKWDERKADLLAVQPIYWKETPMPGGGVQHTRIDPEAEHPPAN